MTTTNHQIADQPSQHGIARSSGGWLACNCGEGRFSDAEMARHLLDAGRDEGRQEGYAAGLAAAKGELVAADDPRVKPGAHVRVEFDSLGTTMTREALVEGWDPYGSAGSYLLAGGGLIENATRIYLLAEAPDPDAEVLGAIGAADEASSTYAGKLDALRERGFDVVKVVAK